MNGLKEFVVIDVETTGVLRNCDRIIEIGMIRVKGEEIISELNTLICPNRDLGPTNIHRITAAQVADAPRFDEIAGDVVELLRGAVVVAHNAHFDVGMLGSEFERLGLEIGDLPMICTMGLAYEFGPSSRRLESCCEHFGIHITNAHAAYSDAQATLHLFKCYLQVMKERSTDLQAVRAYRAGSHRTLPYVKPSGRRWLRSDCSSLVRADYIASCT
jgi:DNA polymerase III epsilon subunit family exonuclease